MKSKKGYCIVYEWPTREPYLRKAVLVDDGKVWETLKAARAFKKMFLPHIGVIVKIG